MSNKINNWKVEEAFDIIAEEFDRLKHMKDECYYREEEEPEWLQEDYKQISKVFNYLCRIVEGDDEGVEKLARSYGLKDND